MIAQRFFRSRKSFPLLLRSAFVLQVGYCALWKKLDSWLVRNSLEKKWQQICLLYYISRKWKDQFSRNVSSKCRDTRYLSFLGNDARFRLQISFSLWEASKMAELRICFIGIDLLGKSAAQKSCKLRNESRDGIVFHPPRIHSIASFLQ